MYAAEGFKNTASGFYWGNEYLRNIEWDTSDQSKLIRSMRVSSNLLFL
jgi:hypothetical protein